MSMEGKFVDLRCVNTATTLSVEFGTSLCEVLSNLEFEQPYPILAARVNNAYKDLSYKVYKPVTVEFFDVRHFEGYRVYQRTLSFVMQMASLELFADDKLRIRHSLGHGFYAEFDSLRQLSDEQIALLKSRMHDIVSRKLPITRHK